MKVRINDEFNKGFDSELEFQKYFFRNYPDINKIDILDGGAIKSYLPNNIERIYSFAINSDNDKQLIKIVDNSFNFERVKKLRWSIKILCSEQYFIKAARALDDKTFIYIVVYNKGEYKIVYVDEKFISIGKNKLTQKIANLNYKIKTRHTTLYEE